LPSTLRPSPRTAKETALTTVAESAAEFGFTLLQPTPLHLQLFGLLRSGPGRANLRTQSWEIALRLESHPFLWPPLIPSRRAATLSCRWSCALEVMYSLRLYRSSSAGMSSRKSHTGSRICMSVGSCTSTSRRRISSAVKEGLSLATSGQIGR
jgi:hypothetical protein